MPVYCETHCGKQIQILVGCPGGQVSVFSLPNRQGHTILPSTVQRLAGGPKGSILAKGFTRTGKDLAYYPERQMWVEGRGHFGTDIMDQMTGLV